MITDKPACQDFLIEAIRALRRRPGNMRGYAAAGVPLEKLFAISSEAYTADEFRVGLKYLMDRKNVVLVARVADYELTDVDASKKDDRYGTRGHRLTWLSSVPADLPAGQYERWKIGEDGMSVVRDDAVRFSEARWAMLYVAKDGLPKKVAVLLAGHGGGATAQSIIEAMQKKKKPIPKKKK